MPSISLFDPRRAHYETHTFQWITSKSSCHTKLSQFNHIPVIHYSTLTKEDTFEDVMTNTVDDVIKNTAEVESEHIKVEYNNANESVRKTKKKLALILDSKTTDTTCQTEEKKFDVGSDMETNDVNNGLDYDDNDLFNVSCMLDNKADGSTFNEEYAQMVPISVKEAKAAIEVKKLYMSGLHKCEGCGRAFKTKKNLKVHSRMHDKVSQVSFQHVIVGLQELFLIIKLKINVYTTITLIS